MPAPVGLDDLAGLTPSEIARGRALRLVADFAAWLRDDRQIEPAAIGSAMVMVGVRDLKIDPRDLFDQAFARALLDALCEIVETPSEQLKRH